MKPEHMKHSVVLVLMLIVAQCKSPEQVGGPRAERLPLRAELSQDVALTNLTAFSEARIEVEASPGPLPSVALAAPLEGATLKGPTPVAGMVSGGEWRVEYTLGDEDAARTWKTIASGEGSASGPLATFDPTLLLNGGYTLRLVSRTTAGAATASLPVVVEGQRKVGPYTASFEDLEVPLTGLPIQLTRTYDSRDTGAGDFGLGWRLAQSNVRVETSTLLGRHARVEPLQRIPPVEGQLAGERCARRWGGRIWRGCPSPSTGSS